MLDACVVFDIDGTLVDSTGFDSDCYVAAVREVAGDVDVDTSWSRYPHHTDTGILMEICRHGNVDYAASVERVRERFAARIAAYLSAGGPCRAIGGAAALVARLKTEPGHALGIATGGFGQTAALKLAHARLDVADVPLASADDHHTRVGIMQRCRARLPPAARTIYVGDGEWDRDATAELGWEFVGVGARLRGHCAVWAPDLAADVVYAALGLTRR